MASTQELIERAVERIVGEVPALSRLRLVVRLELRSRGESQIWRVQLPGPIARRDPAADAKVEVSVARSHFNELAADGKLEHWREAYEHGHARVGGQEQLLKLVGKVVERHEQRSRLKKRKVEK